MLNFGDIPSDGDEEEEENGETLGSESSDSTSLSELTDDQFVCSPPGDYLSINRRPVAELP